MRHQFRCAACGLVRGEAIHHFENPRVATIQDCGQIMWGPTKGIFSQLQTHELHNALAHGDKMPPSLFAGHVERHHHAHRIKLDVLQTHPWTWLTGGKIETGPISEKNDKFPLRFWRVLSPRRATTSYFVLSSDLIFHSS